MKKPFPSATLLFTILAILFLIYTLLARNTSVALNEFLEDCSECSVQMEDVPQRIPQTEVGANFTSEHRQWWHPCFKSEHESIAEAKLVQNIKQMTFLDSLLGNLNRKLNKLESRLKSLEDDLGEALQRSQRFSQQIDFGRFGRIDQVRGAINGVKLSSNVQTESENLKNDDFYIDRRAASLSGGEVHRDPKKVSMDLVNLSEGAGSVKMNGDSFKARSDEADRDNSPLALMAEMGSSVNFLGGDVLNFDNDEDKDARGKYAVDDGIPRDDLKVVADLLKVDNAGSHPRIYQQRTVGLLHPGKTPKLMIPCNPSKMLRSVETTKVDGNSMDIFLREINSADKVDDLNDDANPDLHDLAGARLNSKLQAHPDPLHVIPVHSKYAARIAKHTPWKMFDFLVWTAQLKEKEDNMKDLSSEASGLSYHQTKLNETAHTSGSAKIFIKKSGFPRERNLRLLPGFISRKLVSEGMASVDKSSAANELKRFLTKRKRSLVRDKRYSRTLNVHRVSSKNKNGKEEKDVDVADTWRISSADLASEARINELFGSSAARRDVQARADPPLAGGSALIPSAAPGLGDVGPLLDSNPQASFPWLEPRLMSNCWVQAMLGGRHPYSPSCNPDGTYQPKQCYLQRCWCVNPEGKPVAIGLSTRFSFNLDAINLQC